MWKACTRTYRILVLNSTAIVCAIVLILLTNSMPASRATAITQSLSQSVFLLLVDLLALLQSVFAIRLAACLQRQLAIAFARVIILLSV